MNRMRIGLLCHHGFGGSTRVALDLATSLAERGHDVHLFTRRPPLGMREIGFGVTLHTCDPTITRTHRLETDWSTHEIEAFVERVVRESDALGLDVLHFHYAVPFAEIALACRRRARRAAPALVGTLHGTDVSPSTGVLGDALGQLDALTTVSRTHAELARALLGLSRPPEVIPNFVDQRMFRPPPTRGHTHPPRVAHVSNFRPVKEPAMVARVFASVARATPAELWLVGDGEQMPIVREILEREGVDRRVRRFGLTRRVPAILPRADVLLLTSRSESFSLAALEAAACGLPVVAPAVGGLPEVVVDGTTGILFEPGDEAGAARAVIRLLTEPALRAEMSHAAVRRAMLFARDRIVPRYESLYRSVIARSMVSAEPA